MVRAGEAGGILDEILDRLAVQQEKQAEMRGKLKSAATYPAVILTITFVAFYFLMVSVVPKIGKIIVDIAGPDYETPIYTKAMLAISDVLQNDGLKIIGFGIVFFFAFRKCKSTTKGKRIWDSFLLRIPVVNKIITKVALSQFARTFSALSAAGVSVLDALDVTANAINNSIISGEIKKASTAIKNGKPLSEPFANSKIFPPILSQMIAVGEETGELESILNKLAEFYEQEVDEG